MTDEELAVLLGLRAVPIPASPERPACGGGVPCPPVEEIELNYIVPSHRHTPGPLLLAEPIWDGDD